ncbi:MAG: HAD-IC family P-type ATPase [Lachnospiraceae bacterium]|nr:HAD-IC family P-type ATPase [Lachnospiraceae bacterium]
MIETQNEELNIKLTQGLSAEQVEEKINQGLVNGDLDVKTKSYKQIVKDNLFSLFNLVNAILVTCIIIVGSWKNALFFLVVIWNFGLSCLQEIRAKKTIEKLSLLSAPKAHVLRSGELKEVPVKDILLGDIMQLKNGYQICADAVVLDGECQVNESLITGESTPIYKKTGDHLLSGSFLISGKVMAEVEHIGEENFVNKITLGAKYLKKSNSVIMKSVKSIVRVLAILIIPLAGLFVWNNFFHVEQSFTEAMVHTVAAVSAMVPGGLVLIVTMVLAVSVVRLSVHHTLVQDLYSVENLARVDVLCLDKTGTITEGSMKVETILDFHGNEVNKEDSENSAIYEDIKRFALSIDDENTTLDAIRSFFEIEKEHLEIRNENLTIPFSSDKKWSLLSISGQGSLILGASEFVLPEQATDFEPIVEKYTKNAKRVVLFAKSKGLPLDENGAESESGKFLPKGIEPCGFIVIGDKVREDAADTLNYFKKQDVLLKVISGDDPVTVSKVAAEAGLDHADRYIDATCLTSYEEIEQAVDKYTIFGRVTPYQKLDIVKALKAHGHTVAMTGDGANDVLALKEADCSVAMQSGSDAARNVANMVLMDSNFASLPLVLGEGRKSINNLQRSAALYLTKTTYAVILAIIFVFVTSIAYPFENIQVTLIGGITIGIPSFCLALEPNNNRIKKHFLWNVFKVAIPTGIFTLFAIIGVDLFAGTLCGADAAQISTMATFTALIVGILAIFDISGKMNKWKWGMLVLLIALSVGAILVAPGLFSLVPITWTMWRFVLLMSAAFFLIHGIIFRIIVPKVEAKREAKELEARYGQLKE